jgi:cation diffusion facilitator CzcD-associated flavoprotein CzcO
MSVTGTLHPRHVIQATGLNGEPRIPIIPGMHTFVGPSCHSSEIKTGTLQHAGKKVVIVGTGCSAHDIADELHRNGAHVTFIQRSPTYVISLASTLAMMKTRYDEGKITEDSDLLSASTPTMVAQRVGSDAARLFGKRDRELLDGLKAAGFNLDESFPSPANLTIHRAGGFYIDTGTSSLISSGAIKVKNASQITQIKPRSLILANSNGGEEIEVDEIVFATGYENGRVRTRKVFGDEVADNIDPIWGYNEMGEIRGVFRRSGHEGFWVAAGSFWLSRYYSRLLALQIKMVEEGLVGL